MQSSHLILFSRKQTSTITNSDLRTCSFTQMTKHGLLFFKKLLLLRNLNSFILLFDNKEVIRSFKKAKYLFK